MLRRRLSRKKNRIFDQINRLSNKYYSDPKTSVEIIESKELAASNYFGTQFGTTIASGAFALVWGCGAGALSAGGDLNIVIPQILAGIILSLILIYFSKFRNFLKMILIPAAFMCFGLVYMFAFYQFKLKEEEDVSRRETVIKIRNELSDVKNQLQIQKQDRINEEYRRALSENPAALEPGTSNKSTNICPGNDTLNVIIGSNVFGSNNSSFVAIEVDKTPLLTVRRNAMGGLFVTFDLRNSEDELIARVKDNVVYVPPTQGFIEPRQSLDNLSINDKNGNIIMSISYANKNELYINGSFTKSGRRIVATPFGILSPIRISNSKFCDAKVGIAF